MNIKASKNLEIILSKKYVSIYAFTFIPFFSYDLTWAYDQLVEFN